MAASTSITNTVTISATALHHYRGLNFARPGKRLSLTVGKGKVRVKGLGRWLKRLPKGTDVSYSWRVGGKRVTGSKRTLRLKPSYEGKRVRVVIKLRKPGYRRTQVTSARVGVR